MDLPIGFSIFASKIYQECYAHYADEQKDAISKLKQPTAISNRKDITIKVGYSAKYLFKTLDLDSTKDHLEAIEDIRKTFYSYQPNKQLQ